MFTKLLKSVFSTLRKQSNESVCYIDDAYFDCPSYEQCQANIQNTVHLFEDLGFIIHPEKSVLIPVQEICFLGFILNSKNMTVSLTREKVVNIQTQCSKLIKTKTPAIRFVSEVLGYLVSSFPGVKFGMLYYRSIEVDKNKALTYNKGDYNAPMVLSKQAIKDLQWWITSGVYSPNPVSYDPPHIILKTDASNSGWGGVITDLETRANGSWSLEESSLHINCLELKAVLLSLQSLCNSYHNKHIRILTDNTCTVSYIKHFGGCKSQPCNSIARDIWSWAIDKNIWLSVAHLPGKLNTSADLESRNINEDCEWKLCESVFKTICDTLSFTSNIDLFASRLNYQLEPFVSFQPDPQSFAINAFSLIDWAKWDFYAFPPFSVISLVLQKVITDKATGILIVPDWPTQVWYPTLFKLNRKPPVLLSRKKQFLYLPSHPSRINFHCRNMSNQIDSRLNNYRMVGGKLTQDSHLFL